MQLIMVEHFEVFHSVYFHILVSLQLHQPNAYLLFITNLCHVSSTCFGVSHTIWREKLTWSLLKNSCVEETWYRYVINKMCALAGVNEETAGRILFIFYVSW